MQNERGKSQNNTPNYTDSLGLYSKKCIYLQRYACHTSSFCQDTLRMLSLLTHSLRAQQFGYCTVCFPLVFLHIAYSMRLWWLDWKWISIPWVENYYNASKSVSALSVCAIQRTIYLQRAHEWERHCTTNHTGEWTKIQNKPSNQPTSERTHKPNFNLLDVYIICIIYIILFLFCGAFFF